MRRAASVLRRIDGPDRIIVTAWIGTRVSVFLSYIAVRIIVDQFGVAMPIPLAQGLGAWDGAYYLDLARAGYDGVSPEAARFFPLLPLLIRAVAVITRSEVMAGVLIVNSAALAAGLVARRVAARAGVGADTGLLAAVVVVAGPTAFTTVLIYSESLFLLFTAVVWLGLLDRRPALTAAAGYLGGLCRPVGALLAVPVLIEGLRRRRPNTPRAWARVLTPAAAPVAGLLTFLVWSAIALDDFSAPFTVQEGIRGDLRNPFGVVADHARDLFGDERLGDGLHLVAALALVALAVAGFRLLSAGWALFSAVNVAIFLTAPNLNSVERYGGSLLPLVVTGAILAHKAIRRTDLALVVVVGLSATIGSLLMTISWLGSFVP